MTRLEWAWREFIGDLGVARQIEGEHAYKDQAIARLPGRKAELFNAIQEELGWVVDAERGEKDGAT